MYEMGLLTKPRTKSANIVGQTMKLSRGKANPQLVIAELRKQLAK